MRAGNGTGTVTSSPAGITCGADCSESYAPGTRVTLTAVAASDATFMGWSGGCTGTGTCQVTLDQAVLVTATFALQQHTLTVARTGDGGGTVTSSPAGITCGADCSEIYDSGTVVTLTATPNADSTFAGWSGACSGTGTCQVTATASVSATFSLGGGFLAVTVFYDASIEIFPSTASGNTAPLRTISGAATTLAGPRDVVVFNNEIIVADQGGNSIDVFPVTASGNVAPIRRIVGPSSGISIPAGVLVFGGEIYVGQQNGVVSVFPLAANGDVAPSRTITGLHQTQSIAIADGELYVTEIGLNRILVFPINASGAATPTRIISGAAADLQAPAGLVVSNGEIFVSHVMSNEISVFPQSANGNITPRRAIIGVNTTLNQPLQIAIFAGEIYVANFSNNPHVLIFPVNASGNVAPTRQFVVPGTARSAPAGVCVF